MHFSRHTPFQTPKMKVIRCALTRTVLLFFWKGTKPQMPNPGSDYTVLYTLYRIVVPSIADDAVVIHVPHHKTTKGFWLDTCISRFCCAATPRRVLLPVRTVPPYSRVILSPIIYCVVRGTVRLRYGGGSVISQMLLY